jgi:hypothetical protein
MAIQTAGTTELDEAQRIIIAKSRYTQEHVAPMLQLAEHFTLAKGEKQLTIPKVGQMDASDLTDGVDMTASEDIGMTADQIDTEEVGLKVIITDKLARQLNEDVFAMVGKQVGDAMARKKDKDLLALFDSLGGDADGGDAVSLAYYGAVSSILRGTPVPLPIVAVLHPYQAYVLKAAVATAGTYELATGIVSDVIKQWQVGTWAGVPCYEDGNITIASSMAHGAMFSKTGCLGYLQSLADTTERERDASLRATELVIVCDYEAFAIDTTYGYDMYYAATTPTYYTA